MPLQNCSRFVCFVVILLLCAATAFAGEGDDGSVEGLSDLDAQPFYVQGFQLASMLVVLVLLTGGVIAYFHKTNAEVIGSLPSPASAPAGGDD